MPFWSWIPRSLYKECPDLRSLLVKTEGFVYVGVPIGHLSFLDTYLQQVIVDPWSFRNLFLSPTRMIFCSWSTIAAIKKCYIWNEPFKLGLIMALIYCFTHSISLTRPMLTARLGHTVAKATVMHLLALQRLTLPPPTDSSSPAWNHPGQADSESFFSFLSHSLSFSIS